MGKKVKKGSHLVSLLPAIFRAGINGCDPFILENPHGIRRLVQCLVGGILQVHCEKCFEGFSLIIPAFRISSLDLGGSRVRHGCGQHHAQCGSTLRKETAWKEVDDSRSG